MQTQIRPLRALPQLRHRRLRLSIAQQIRYGLFIFTLLSLVPTAGLLIYLSSQAQVRQVMAVQQERSRATAREIDAYLDDLQRKLGYLARVRGLTDLDQTTQQRLLEALTRHNDAYETVALTDVDGNVGASVSPYDIPIAQDVSELGVFRRALATQSDFIGPVEVDSTTKLPIVTVGVPVRNEQDQVAGVLLARINLKFLWFVVSRVAVGETGYVYIADTRNVVIAEKGSRPETFQLQPIAQPPFSITSTAALVSPSEPYTGLHGTEVIGSASRIASTNWTVVVELPTTEAYGPVRQSLQVLLAALALAALVALSAGFIYSRQIMQPLDRLTTAAERISTGDLHTSVSIGSRDEFGLLATTFNSMTSQLRGLFEALRKERNFVSAILDIAGALIVVQDPQGRIVRFNRACTQTTGYDIETVRGRPIWEVVLPPEAVAPVQAVFEQMQTAMTPLASEHAWLTRDGQQRMIAWSHTTLRDDMGAPEFIVSVGIDITERKQTEAQLVALTRNLQQSNHDLEQFAYVASHDLQEPLRMVTSYVQLLAKRYNGRLDDKADRYIAYAVDGAARMQTLINDLLQYSRVGRQDVTLTEIDAERALQRALTNLKLAVNESQATITHDRLPGIYADASQLTQVFQNLIGNALKFRGTEPPLIHIGVQQTPTEWIFSVRDNGIGIEPQYSERIFTMFQRLHSRGEYPGTGIGLAICKKIVERHHGWINVVSEPGHGATFSFSIPAEPRTPV